MSFLMKSKWCGWGVTSIGPSHIISGLPNQDAWFYRQFVWGEVIVISDGVGSHKHSDIGSKMACLAVVEATKIFTSTISHFYREEIENFFRLIHSIWRVKLRQYLPSETSATCLFAIRYKEKILLGRLGDGLIIVTSDIEDSIILCDNKVDSFSNLTSSLTSEFSFNEWEYSILDANIYNSVLLCTDGVSDDLIIGNEENFARSIYDTYKSYNPKKRSLEILHWLKNWPTPKHTDDKTIACLDKVNIND
jgi:serine/threonine protein phosphatase PrpC